MKTRINPSQAAGFYLLARGRPGQENQKEDHAALTQLLVESMKASVIESLEWAKNTYREIHPGGCKMFSQGDACRCFLCQCDEQRLALGIKET